MDAEHRGRYWWAAQIAPGRDVLDAACGTGYGMAMLAEAGAKSVAGVDIAPDAVAEARSRCGDPGAVHEADVRRLPFAEDSFDLVVCWETIEHVAEGEQVIDEFRRVLRPGGILLVSSPNPAVYPPGNEHHVHEYRPEELLSLVGSRFSHVAAYRQHSWLASAIEAAKQSSNGGPAAPAAPAAASSNGEATANGHRPADVRGTRRLQPGEETYGIVAAGDAPLPDFNQVVSLGGDFEIRWWIERVRDAEAKIGTEARRLAAEAAGREAELRERLDKTSTALHEANQALAEVPVLRHRAAQAQGETEALRAVYAGSRSWRLTAPLRRLARIARARR
jgi:SAM-dependent methyltransferase